MRVDLTDLSPVKKSMVVEVDSEEVAQETEAVVRRFRQSARIPGFRPGKAPLSVVRTRFAKQVEEDVRDRMLSRYYHKAAEEKGLRPIGDPVLEEVQQKDGEPFSFKTTFEVLPQIDLQSYKGVEARRPGSAVSDADVEHALEELRQSRTTWVAEEGRKAVTGDRVVADIEGTPEGGEAFRHERMNIEVGKSDNLPAFNENLLDVSSGIEKTFPVAYPKEYGSQELAGKTVAYRIEVHEVRRRQLPELDDEFAKDLGDFDDLTALRARIREDLEARKKHEAERGLRQSVVDKVLLANPIVLPEILVEDEINGRLKEIVSNMMMQGMDPEKVELDWIELRKRQEEPARKAVHARLILDAVARVEGIEVSAAEVESRLEREAQAMGEKVEALKQRLEEHHGVKALASQLLREKSLDLLVSVANIQSEE